MTLCWCKELPDYECSLCEKKRKYKKLTSKQRVLVEAISALLKDNVTYEEIEEDYCDLTYRLQKEGLEWSEYL